MLLKTEGFSISWDQFFQKIKQEPLDIPKEFWDFSEIYSFKTINVK